jgi:hypothetical protein
MAGPAHGPIRLRPVGDPDVGLLYGHAAANPAEWFPLSGRQVGPFEFQQHLWADVLDQLVVHVEGAPGPVGLLRVVQPDLTNGFARFERRQVLACPSDWFDTALFLFLEHAFATWPLRKVYVERAGFEEPPLASFAEICEPEGRLANHVFHDRLYWDYFIDAVYYERWDEWKHRARDRFLPPLSTSAATPAASGPVVRISGRSFPVT